jgi:hypothetical protein
LLDVVGIQSILALKSFLSTSINKQPCINYSFMKRVFSTFAACLDLAKQQRQCIAMALWVGERQAFGRVPLD